MYIYIYTIEYSGLLRALNLFPPLVDDLQPGQRGRPPRYVFVDPMRCGAVLSHVVHVQRPNLDFEWLRTNQHRRVQAPVSCKGRYGILFSQHNVWFRLCVKVIHVQRPNLDFEWLRSN